MSLNKIVSIWTANTGWDSPTLQDVMSPDYSDDGDFLGSEFSRAFSLDFVDDDVIEADIVEPTNSLARAIEGGSYDLDIITDMRDKNTDLIDEPIDTIIAVYDYSFHGNPKNNMIRGKLFIYRGSFAYKN